MIKKMKSKEIEPKVVKVTAKMKPEFTGLGVSRNSKYDQLPLRLDIAISEAIRLNAVLHQFRCNLDKSDVPAPDAGLFSDAMVSILRISEQLHEMAEFSFELDDGRKATLKARKTKKAKR
jgi:hypothetical protein